MESEENTNKNPGGQQTVTPVGNAWVLCRSKSYPGRIYYFNTLTGEAVWNLSNEEIDKAKKRTAKLPLQLENFPEPQGPPVGHCSHDTYPNNTQQPDISQYTSPKVYNKQIINNQFTRSQFPPFTNTCQNCTPINSINSIQSMVGIRPNMWIHPPPIFLGPQASPLTNIIQTTENVSNNNHYNQDFTAQNTSLSLSRRFTFANNRARGKNFSMRPHGSGIFTPRNVRKPFPKRMQNQNGVSDLRTIITGKKTENGTKEGQQNTLDTVKEPVYPIKTSQESVTSAPQLESKTFETDLFVNVDDEWLKNNGTIDGAKLKLDVTILKNFATENSNCEGWYIVVDKNVLMEHFNFLNVLTTSDSECKLMVVRSVMSELQAAARADVAKDGARKVLRGLSQMFAAKLAVIAEYSFKPNEMEDCTGMINFCSMLQQQNEHIVLLSNEDELHKHTSNVPIFTIQDVKELLTSEKNKQIKIINPIIERNIEITIPNDIQSLEQSTFHDEAETVQLDVNESTRASPGQKCSPKKSCPESNTKETNVQTDDVIPAVRKMVDAEVQTDPNLGSTQSTIQKDSVGVNTVDNITQVSYVDRETNVDTYNIPENNTTVSQENNTRELRLKRSVSNLTMRSNSNDTEKKHFKWHRKRNDGSVGFSDSTSSLDDRASRVSSTPFEVNAYLPQISNIHDAINLPRSQSSQMLYSDFGEGSEASSCVLMPRETTGNITIEETSTSDEISNSVSNVDSESTHEIKKSKEKPNYRNYEVQSKNVMFEITCKEMEQNLKVRRDEWLAEFNQIMEEVLTQILRRKSEDIVKAMPPPWTLHEATECIKRTFIADSDVFDAATKLSNVIHRMSDMKGKIKIDFNPNEFMELYSYGVYLVDSLQTILDKCEDLQVASESLAKLLKHIENPITEGGHNDSFDDTAEVSVIISQSSTEEAINQESRSVLSNKSTTPQRTLKDQSNQSPGKYYLRSSRKTKTNEQENVESPTVKFIRKINIHDDFFTSLHLLRKGETAKENPVEFSQNSVKDNSTKADKAVDKGPNIIRNFTTCPEIEEKLNKQSREPLDMDKLDYSMGYNDYECDNMEGSYLNDYDHNFIIEGNDECLNSSRVDSGEATVDSNNNDLKILVASLMDEIKETTANVYSFCKKTQDEIQSEIMSSDKRIEIHEKAQKANAHIQNICNSFRKIQEGNMNQNDVRSRLKEAGILLNDKELLVYRDVIGSCIEQGDILLESVNIIIDAVKT